MKKFKVLLSETAAKSLQAIYPHISEGIKSHLKELEIDPFRARPKADIKVLHGFEKPHLFRIRIGEYRAVYFVVGDDVKVTEIIHRGKGYKWLE